MVRANKHREVPVGDEQEPPTEMPIKDRVIFILTGEDVINCAREMGMPAEVITEDVLEAVKKGVEWGLECWSDIVKEAINIALKS